MLAITMLGSAVNAPTVMLANFVATPIELRSGLILRRPHIFIIFYALKKNCLSLRFSTRGGNLVYLSMNRGWFGV